MLNPYEEIFTPLNAAYIQAVLRNTWGHLRPKRNISYKGSILFTVSGYNESNGKIVESQFVGLEDSPWLYDRMKNIIWNEWIKKETPTGLYLWKGILRNYKFTGKPKLIYSLESQNKKS